MRGRRAERKLRASVSAGPNSTLVPEISITQRNARCFHCDLRRAAAGAFEKRRFCRALLLSEMRQRVGESVNRHFVTGCQATALCASTSKRFAAVARPPSLRKRGPAAPVRRRSNACAGKFRRIQASVDSRPPLSSRSRPGRLTAPLRGAHALRRLAERDHVCVTCVKRRRSTSSRCPIPLNTVPLSLRACPGPNRSSSSALLFAHECCVRSSRLARDRRRRRGIGTMLPKRHHAGGVLGRYPAISSTDGAKLRPGHRSCPYCLLDPRPRFAPLQSGASPLAHESAAGAQRSPVSGAYSRAARCNRPPSAAARRMSARPSSLTSRAWGVHAFSPAPSSPPVCCQILLGKGKSGARAAIAVLGADAPQRTHKARRDRHLPENLPLGSSVFNTLIHAPTLPRTRRACRERREQEKGLRLIQLRTYHFCDGSDWQAAIQQYIHFSPARWDSGRWGGIGVSPRKGRLDLEPDCGGGKHNLRLIFVIHLYLSVKITDRIENWCKCASSYR